MSSSASLFAAVKGRLGVIAGLAVLSAVAAVVPYVAIAELARTLWPALSGGPVDRGRAWLVVVVAGVTLVVSFAAAGVSGLVSHLADNDLQHDLRRRIVAHLRRLPLGWFDVNTSATVKKAAENDVAKLHQLIAHSILDFITAALVPLLSLAYL
ncbi:MAG: ABC transporter ATP-binding protein, partial [Propionibacteriaceae bacterium]|nr:ABC transporter ATP-binding protein [Propionibacteriaceae bacterium]